MKTRGRVTFHALTSGKGVRAVKAMAILAMAAVTCALGCASGESYVKPGYDFGRMQRVAVVDVESRVHSQALKNEIADYMTIQFFSRGYTMVERGQIEQVLKEHDFEHSGVTTPEDAVEEGRILNVDGVIIVNMPEFGEHISMTAKMLDVKTGEIVWMGEGSGSTGQLLATVGGAVVGGAAGVAMGGNRPGRVVGGIAGGALGGVAGHALSPAATTQVRKVIEQVCKNLPTMVPRGQG